MTSAKLIRRHAEWAVLAGPKTENQALNIGDDSMFGGLRCHGRLRTSRLERVQVHHRYHADDAAAARVPLRWKVPVLSSCLSIKRRSPR